MIERDKMFFLLGGYDLEMLTIREILVHEGIAFADHQLRWDNALLSDYQQVLSDIPESYTVWGIELQEDIPLIANYKRIDHHNQYAELPSALEQVVELLNLSMTRYWQLVAANDKAYIPGMLAMGATEEEIKSIRKADRQAQGVGEVEELLAEKAIAENLEKTGNLLKVYTSNSCFSPICDRLFPYQRLLIYTDDEWMYYGKDSLRVRDLFEDEFQQGNLFYGGGSDGYVGSKRGRYIKDKIWEMVKQIDEYMDFYSYHIFYFPFKWEIKGAESKTFSEQVDLNRIPISLSSAWERVQLDNKTSILSGDRTEQEELFGERQYYFDFVHPVLYDFKGVENSIIHHYERKEPKEGNVEYHIEVKNRTYVLKVDALNVNLYAMGVGIMSFFLKNEKEDQKDELSIRDINQFGRRIMPPHCNEFIKENRSLIAQSIRITGLKGEPESYLDSFDYKNDFVNEPQCGLLHVWYPARFIRQLITDLSSDMQVTPVIDDRMLVNCWYGNNDLSKEIMQVDNQGNVPFVDTDFWYKYVFVDSGKEHDDVTCQNPVMRKTLLGESTYCRWQEMGTLYGVSRYSFVALTNTTPFAKNVLAMHMRTIYSRMFELVILQRASILRFSGEITKVSSLKGGKDKEIAKRIRSLYKEYIRFINQIYFQSVTVQDQGIELYDLLLKQFKSDVKIKDLDAEISELQQYITLIIDQHRNENGEMLNFIAASFLPASFLTGIFGMNSLITKEWGVWLIQFSVILIAIGAAVLLLRYISRKKN